MIADMGYKATRYRNVYWRGDSLYYRVRGADRRWSEVLYGKGSPKEASDAQRIAQEDADAIRNRVKDPRQVRAQESSRRPLAALVDEYAQHLSGDSAHHIKMVRSYLNRWAVACEVERVLDADAHRLNKWLKTFGARSHNYARSSVLGFLRWAADFGRAPYNPVPSGQVKKANEDADRRRLSRSMAGAEFEMIIQAAPLYRQAYYLTLAGTGLRWRELGRLTWANVDLDAAVIIAPAGQTKNDKRAEIPMPGPVVNVLRRWKNSAGPESETCPIFTREPRLKTWKADLIAAGLVRPYCDIKTRAVVMAGYADDRGRRLDRKCLRLSFGTWLKEAKVDLRDAQRLMRHSDPKLTANIYTDLRLSGLRAAVDGIAANLPSTNCQQETPKSGGSSRLSAAVG